MERKEHDPAVKEDGHGRDDESGPDDGNGNGNGNGTKAEMEAETKARSDLRVVLLARVRVC